ncbi:UvrD-helicase domain-containing protein [Salinibacterium sp. ZJ70]|uniref:UvrD-helicase domain-containing protein n=1 Tax=Salinibacterium sp. ZJ70 TaxID=2708084 RepID=UPI00141FBF91|nr:UvrD-helicase domain-containing protein [Salinibacterium sp. ZJ70]
MTVTELDDSQRAVVEIGYGTRQVVTAGPGAGKTETVSALLEHLVEDEGLAIESELLVISFSNAAVDAVDRRLRAKSLPPATIQTLDSLAADIIRDLGSDDFSGMSFDQRVVEARRLLSEDDWPRLEDLLHLVVDEVQDIVGVRADLLDALLERLDPKAGFTLLGDLAQGIYDFQIRDRDGSPSPASKTTAVELLHHAYSEHGAEQRVLTGQYRARTRETFAAISLRSSALTADERSEIAKFRASLVVAGDISETATAAARWKGTTAFLTSTNGQALLIAQQLGASGYPVELRRSPRDIPYAGWIAQALGRHPRRGISRSEFEEAVSGSGPMHPSADMWRALRAVTDARSSELDLTHLAARLAIRRSLVPALTGQQTAGMVVSTIHRAKGLEFDNVVLVDFPERFADEEDASAATEAARVQFVALTRAAGRIVRATGPSDAGLTSTVSPTGGTRWVRKGFKGGVTAIELMPSDVAPFELQGEDGLRAQDALLTSTSGSVDLDLVMNPRRSTLDLPVYSIRLGGIEVAVTSEAFGAAIARQRFKTDDRARPVWPSLRGAVGHPPITIPERNDSIAAPWGLWLAPRISGFLHIDWKAAS